MSERKTAAEVGAMGHLQFMEAMDALLESDEGATFVDPTTQTGSQPQYVEYYSPGVFAAATTRDNGTTRTTDSGGNAKSTHGYTTAQCDGTDEANEPGISPLNESLHYPFKMIPALTNAPVSHYPAAVASSQQAIAPPARLHTFTTMPASITGVVSFPAAVASQQPIAPPVALGRRESSIASIATKKRSRDPRAPCCVSPVSEDESDEQQRRITRNQREQQRSQQISEQINVLKEVLDSAAVQFKPDKYSTLVTVGEYIKQLQVRSILLDSEHKKLLDTITKTNELVNRPPPYYQTTVDGDASIVSNDLLSDLMTDQAMDDEFAVFVNGFDYCNVFKQCGIPLAVASIDGRFLDCTEEFETLSGYRRTDLLPMEASSNTNGPKTDLVSSKAQSFASVSTAPHRSLSLFNMIIQSDLEQVFLAMSRMLKQPTVFPNNDHTLLVNGEQSIAPDINPAPDFCFGEVRTQSRQINSKIRMKITLLRSPQGRPKFFNCALTPINHDETAAEGAPGESNVEPQLSATAA